MIDLIFIFHDVRNALFGEIFFLLHNINPLLVAPAGFLAPEGQNPRRDLRTPRVIDWIRENV